MEKEDNKFIFENENGEKINCEMLLSFYLKDRDKNYMLFTDNTYDEESNLKVYPYYNTSSNEEMIPVTDESEFAIIDNMYQNIVKMVNSND